MFRFIVPYFYITEHLLQNGYTEEDGATLIAVIGVFNTIGMIALGWAGDQPWLNVTLTYGGMLISKYCLLNYHKYVFSNRRACEIEHKKCSRSLNTNYKLPVMITIF